MNKILLKYSLYINFISDSNGGAIFISADDDVSVSMSVFEKCQAANSGGGIFAEAINMSFRNICFFQCSAKSSLAIRSQNKNNDLMDSFVSITQNSVKQSSMLPTANKEDGSSFMNFKQNSFMKDINITNTILNHIAGVYCKESPIANHSFFNLIGNQATKHGVLSQYSAKNIITFSYANCISNKCPASFPLIRKVESAINPMFQFNVQHSNFISNTAYQSIFSTGISVRDCYLFNNNPNVGTSIKHKLDIIITDPECNFLEFDNGFLLEMNQLCTNWTYKFKKYPHISPCIVLFVFQYK